jgi:hypothetical protein
MSQVQPGLMRGVAGLTACTLLLMAGGMVWLAARGALDAWPAVVVAGLVCWAGVVGGLVIAALASRSGNGIGGVLGGMLVRFGLPLGVGVGLTQAQHSLADQGVFSFILVNYLTLLPIETWLSLPYANAAQRPAARKDV